MNVMNVIVFISNQYETMVHKIMYISITFLSITIPLYLCKGFSKSVANRTKSAINFKNTRSCILSSHNFVCVHDVTRHQIKI